MASLSWAQHFFGNATDKSSLLQANGTMPSEEPTTFPNVVSSLAFLFSFSAVNDWLKLIVIGGVFESSRRFLMNLYHKFLDSFFIRASFDSNDQSYDWILVWLSKQPSWSRTHDMQITTRVFGGNSPAVVLEGEEEYSHSRHFKSSRKIAYLPSPSMIYSLWFKRRWMTITRIQRSEGLFGDKENTLHISILTRKHRILTDLLQEARQFYMAGQEHSMCVWASNSSNDWNHIACRAKRSFDSIVLDPGVKDALLEDARDFLRSESWYTERGIPFRRGYLFYGAPGSGKTSMIHCMAGELMLDVYIISLSRAGLDDASLSELVNALPERCIALMEDIDAAFTHGVSRSDTSELDRENDSKKLNQRFVSPVSTSTATSKLSLSGLLNALDGVGAQEGRILFATTNRYSALDQALCRPGRMDVHIEFKNASKYQAKELFKRFYLPTHAEDKDIHGSEKLSIDFGPCNEKSTPEGNATVTPPTELPLSTDEKHAGCVPSISAVRIAALAEQFADAVPDRECSMASLQGYLMSYKTRPMEAAERVIEWVAREKKKKEEQEAEEVKEEENKELTTEPASTCRDASIPFLPCTCRRVPNCSTCGGVKLESILSSPNFETKSPMNAIDSP